MSTRLYTLYKPVRRRMVPGPVVWWFLALALMLGAWITLSPGAPGMMPHLTTQRSWATPTTR